MPIKIPNELPAVKTLENENIFVMTEKRAIKQDIRPLKILILNLMPTKVDTETQLSRLLGNTPLQVEIELMHTKTHRAKNVAEEHLLAFYKEFEDVDYWPELCEIMEWSKSHVQSTLHICWGAQAGLYYHFGIKNYMMDEKLSGVYAHKVDHKKSILFRGFDDMFYVPHSRYTTVRREDIEAVKGLKILASSEKAGVYAIKTKMGRQVFLTGHSEYDPDTLNKEYTRDKSAGLGPKIPENYFPGDDDTKTPVSTWRGHATLLFTNWLNYFVYQTTPYDIMKIKEIK